MNQEKFREQQDRFLLHYPGGFEHPEMLKTVKKHNIKKWVDFIQNQLDPETFEDVDTAVERITKLITGSSLVSVFEKTAYRNMMANMGQEEKSALAESVRELLHGEKAKGFEDFCALLARYKNAKWPIVTALLYYSDPEVEVLIKPSTVKSALAYFEVENLHYVSKPNYDFYCEFKIWVTQLKKSALKELQVENGAFCGFLMFAVGHFD